MPFTTAVRQVLLVSGKGDPGPSLPSWTTTLDVKLAERDQAEHVKLTVHTSAQMTLEWPAFGGVWAGQANFVALPNIETFSVVSDSSPSKVAKNKASKMRWSSSMALGRDQPEWKDNWMADAKQHTEKDMSQRLGKGLLRCLCR